MIVLVKQFITVFIHHFCRDTERNKEIGFLEAQVYEYVEILGVSEHIRRLTVLRFHRSVTHLLVGSEITVLIIIGGNRNRGSWLMRTSRGNKPGLERSVRKRRRSNSVRARVKTKTTRSFTTPRTCHWAGTARWGHTPALNNTNTTSKMILKVCDKSSPLSWCWWTVVFAPSDWHREILLL